MDIPTSDESTVLHTLPAVTSSSFPSQSVMDGSMSDESMVLDTLPAVIPSSSSAVNFNDLVQASTSYESNVNQHPPLRIDKNTVLYRYLFASGNGRMVLNAEPTAAGFLTNQSRNRLTRFIVQIELDTATKKAGNDELDDFTLMGKKFQKWADEIVKTFPGESSSTDYVLYQPKNKRNHSADDEDVGGINAHGKLVFHYEYMRGVLKETGVIKTKNVEPDQPITSSQVQIMNDLRSKITPWNEVIELWRASHESRKQVLKTKKISVENYFNSYATLQTQQGLELLEADFKLQFPEHTLRLKNNWGKVRRYFIQKLQECSVREVSHKAYIQLLPTLSPDIQDIIILYLLPYLVEIGQKKCRKRVRLDPDVENIQNNQNTSSSSNTQRKTNTAKKPFQERQDNFIIHLENAIDIEAIINQVRSRSEVVVFKYQPIPVVIGNLLGSSKFYVIINNKTYEVSSIINAVCSVNRLTVFLTSLVRRAP